MIPTGTGTETNVADCCKTADQPGQQLEVAWMERKNISSKSVRLCNLSPRFVPDSVSPLKDGEGTERGNGERERREGMGRGKGESPQFKIHFNL